MNSDLWLEYFSNNQRADTSIEGPCGAAVPAGMRAELADSLARFQLGEASGGRIASEVETAPDPALDAESRRAIQLYVLEEGRHARELFTLLRALGGQPLSQHWTSDWFRRVRRCLGLRTKLLTMAAAEVVGIVYYSALCDRVPCATVQRTLSVIAREEKRHLDFSSRVVCLRHLPRAAAASAAVRPGNCAALRVDLERGGAGGAGRPAQGPGCLTRAPRRVCACLRSRRERARALFLRTPRVRRELVVGLVPAGLRSDEAVSLRTRAERARKQLPRCIRLFSALELALLLQEPRVVGDVICREQKVER